MYRINVVTLWGNKISLKKHTHKNINTKKSQL